MPLDNESVLGRVLRRRDAELSPMDVLMLKGDADPHTRSIITGVLTLATAPDWTRVVKAFERASLEVPRMRQRVLLSRLPGSAPEWQPDPEFDIGYHVRRIGSAQGAGMAEVLDLAATLSTAPLDPARPLWEATLIDGLPGGEAVLVLRAHHALTDGMGAVEVLAALIDLDPAGDRPTEAAIAGGDALSPDAQGLRGLPRALTTQWRTATRRAVQLSHAGSKFASEPRRTAHATVAMVDSLRRVAGRPAAEPSQLLRERSRRRSFRMVEIPLVDLRTVSKGSDCTINDAYLAAVLGGFRRYHEAMGVTVEDVPLALPINTRAASNTAAGNHISVGRMAGPATTVDPVARMKQVHDLVDTLRSEPAVGAIEAVADVLQHVPSPLAIFGMTTHAQQVDLHASNVAGAPFPVFLAGVLVTSMVPFGPLTGVPVMTVLLSYDGVCRIGLTMDPAAVTEPDLFARCVDEALEELVRPT